MNRIVIVVFGFVLGPPAISQTQIGVKGGFAISTLMPHFRVERPFIGIQASAVAKTQINNRMFLQPALGYYPKGKKRLHEMAGENGNLVSADAIFRFDYIELSTPFQYLLHDGTIQWLAGVGPFVSYATGGRVVFKNFSGPSNDFETQKFVFGKNGLNRADFGMTILFSAIISGHWMFSLNYDQGVTNTDGWSKAKTMSVGLTGGYFFK